jgi:Uma2 family endonuclease
VVQPGLLFVSKAHEAIIQENGVHGAPDAVIEIIFPDPLYYYHFKKRKLDEKLGVQEYWLIDPEDNEVIGYHRNKEGKLAETFREIDILTSTVMNCTVKL